MSTINETVDESTLRLAKAINALGEILLSEDLKLYFEFVKKNMAILNETQKDPAKQMTILREVYNSVLEHLKMVDYSGS
jgi:hypothetical protein